MKPLRVLIDGMRPGLLRDIVRYLVESRRDMELIDLPTDRRSLAEAALAQQAQVVILGLEEDELPRICGEVWSKAPQVVLVGIVGRGRQCTVHALHVDDVGPAQLLATIRAAAGRTKPAGRGRLAAWIKLPWFRFRGKRHAHGRRPGAQ